MRPIRRAAVATASVLCTAAGGTAVAALVEEGAEVDVGGGTIDIHDISGSRTHGTNQKLALSLSGSGLKIRDTGSATLRKGDAQGCDRTISDNSVTCPLTGITRIEVATQFGSDSLTASASVTTPIRFDGGEDNDDATGGGGGDTLGGQSAGDHLSGAGGNDELAGDQGADSLSGGPDDDSLEGGTDDDTLRGNDGVDQLDGGSGDDSLDGGADDDELVGGGGADSLDGGAGSDRLDGRSGGDSIAGGDGLDTYFVPGFAGGQTGARTVTLGDSGVFDGDGDQVAGDVETVVGTSGPDDLVGSPDDRAQDLEGRGGDDQLEGKGGPDVLRGEGGDDVLFTRDGAADTTISCGAGVDRVVADALDFVDADCEDVDRGGTGVTGPGQDDPPGGADDPGEGTAEGGGDSGALPPELTIPPQRSKVSKKGVASVLIRCVYRAAQCKGGVRLVAAAKVKVKVKGKRLTLKKGTRIGAANVNIPWGTSRTVKVVLRKKARRIVAKRARKGIKARVTVRARDSGAGASAAQAKVSRVVKLARRG